MADKTWIPRHYERHAIDDPALGNSLAVVFFNEEKQEFYVALAEGLNGSLSQRAADSLIAVFADAINRARAQ